MNSQSFPHDEPVLCARCAWREFCVKKFSQDNRAPIKCPDFSPDLTLRKGEKESAEKEDKGSTD